MLGIVGRTVILTAFAIAVMPLALASGHGYVEEAQARLTTLEEKYAGLAEATPADKYTYRPGEGVRSTSEVFLHVAGANYFVARAFGTPPPEGLDLSGLQTSTTDKQEVMSTIKKSFDHLRGAIGKVGAGDAEKAMKLFGGDTTTRGALWRALGHLSEHLGQSIAYARVNGVTPPWSQ
jgi:uncharacterized damage-inducible protein DinB